MMDSWQSECVTESSDFESSYKLLSYDCTLENVADSPNVSKDSIESNEEYKIEKNESSKDSKIIGSALAKRRLQAYSNKLQLQKLSLKEDKNEEDKPDLKSPLKKTKKALYPDERAKAVISEIEEIKKKEAEEELIIQEKNRELVAAAMKSIASLSRARSRSTSSEKDGYFKKRHIKSRNYRSFSRKSNSPEHRSRRTSRPNYPKNWTEYREQRLTLAKDEDLKQKLLNLTNTSKNDLVLKLYNFPSPSPLIDPFTFSAVDESIKEIPTPFIRVTKCKPPITFSVNFNQNKINFVNRTQLFQMISSERKHLIEKLISSSGKCNASPKKTQTRHWYHKSWKKPGDAECKVLENSVGLSFLQTYSDEEEENDEDQIIICSSAKNDKSSNETRISRFDTDKNEYEKLKQHKLRVNEERIIKSVNVVENEETEPKKQKNEKNLVPLASPDRENYDVEPGEIIDEDKKDYTPEKRIEESFSDRLDRTDITEDEPADTLILESDNIKSVKQGKVKDHEVDNTLEDSKKDKKKRKTKRSNKKGDSSDFEQPQVSSKSKKRKKKNTKSKRKDYETEESNSDEEEEKSKRKIKKKAKQKKEKKKVKNKKELDTSETKSKKKDKFVDDDKYEDPKAARKKKKKKEKSMLEEDKEKEKNMSENETRKKNKKKLKKKGSGDLLEMNDSEEQKQSNDFDKNKSHKKRKKDRRKTSKDEGGSPLEKTVRSKIVADIEKLEKSDEEYEDMEITRKSKKKRKNMKDFEEDEKKYIKSERSKEKDTSYENLSETSLKKELYQSNRTLSSERRDISTNTKSSRKPKNEEKHSKKKIDETEYNEIDQSHMEDEFPLEKDTYRTDDKVTTPATEEYRGDWESEEEIQTKHPIQLNTSWESEEEIVETVEREPEKPRSCPETFELEMPLNIKPFKKREVKDLEFPQFQNSSFADELENPNRHESVDPDTELQLLKLESQCLTEERRKLEIEKIKVKEFEIQVLKEIKSERVQSDESVVHVEKLGSLEKPKRQRWDKRIAEPKVSTPQKNICDISSIASEMNRENISTKNSSAILENEYEEFMRALNAKNENEKVNSKNFNSFKDLTESQKKSLLNINKDLESKMIKLSKNERITSVESFKEAMIPPQDVQFIPMPSEVKTEIIEEDLPKGAPLLNDIKLLPPLPDIKPVPVPSPKIDLDKMPKPLINLSLSANITLDITSKVDSPSRNSLSFTNTPATIQVPTISKNEAVVSSSGFESKNDSFEAKVNVTSSEVFSEKSGELFPVITTSVAKILTPQKDRPQKVNETNLNSTVCGDDVSSTLTAGLLDNFGVKPFSFSGMVLPSKKSLLDNSNLKLGDSDEEDFDSMLNLSKAPVTAEDTEKDNMDDAREINYQRPEEKYMFGDKKINTTIFKIEANVSNTREQFQAPSKDSKPEFQDKKRPRSKSPPFKNKMSRREDSPRRSRRAPSPRRRHIESPRREFGRDRRGASPPRRHLSPGRRRSSPGRRRTPPGKRRYVSRRSNSPNYRRRSRSPRRKSPKRSVSPRPLVKRPRSRTPDKFKSANTSYKSPDKYISETSVLKSPVTVASPLDRLKRSVADSTISDDLLPQPSINTEEYTNSPLSQFYDRVGKNLESVARVPLDVRINQTLNCSKEEPKQNQTTYSMNYSYNQSQYSQVQQYEKIIKSPVCSSNNYNMNNAASDNPLPSFSAARVNRSKSSFVQVGNVVQIVPTEIHVKTEEVVEKSKIIQVGNILQIVSTEFIPPKTPQIIEPKIEPKEDVQPKTVPEKIEKPSAEEAMQMKVAERRAEREQRRLEKERKRKEKEKRRKEKEKQRQIKLKQKTEDMIKRALQLEVDALGEDELSAMNETPTQWPPPSALSKDANKSILLRGGVSKREKSKVKIVQFADGIRPGEGTSPSGGEELGSSPPRKTLPKEKRYTKTKLFKKIQKKKVKVKVIKKPPEPESDEEEDNLPPPSPPPGSPPPHLFPPRVKPPVINNIHPYVSVSPVSQQVPVQQQTQQIFRQQTISLIMAPPPPPPHHHGPPPPHHGPPHHHAAPPSHHGHHPPPPSPHHGPPAPPHHHGPPLPPHHHGPPPPHHHHPPAQPGPPYHRPPFH